MHVFTSGSSFAATAVAVALGLAAAACGGTVSTTGDTDLADQTDTPPDTPPTDTAPTDTIHDDPPEEDPGPDCPGWRLGHVAASDLAQIDPMPVNTERTYRVAVTGQMGGCDTRAMPVVQIDPAALAVTVTMRAWRHENVDCPAIDWDDRRIVSFRFPAAGTWTVIASPLSAALAVEVEPGPPRPCNVGLSPCGMDCDCPDDGSVCLGGFGLMGPMTACDQPCEEDLDCAAGGSCETALDYFESVCMDSTPQCDDLTDPCPAGWDCAGSACAPAFTLGGSTRVECSCDEDCTPPLACARPASPGGASRCEILCPTSGALNCPGANACGPAWADLSGLASTDSVCGWLGE